MLRNTCTVLDANRTEMSWSFLNKLLKVSAWGMFESRFVMVLKGPT